MTPEAKVKNACRKILDAEKVWYFMPAGGGYGRAGIPDIIACVNGHFLAIECKAADGKTTALQKREIQRIRDSGGASWIAYEDNVPLVRVWVQSLRERNPP